MEKIKIENPNGAIIAILIDVLAAQKIQSLLLSQLLSGTSLLQDLPHSLTAFEIFQAYETWADKQMDRYREHCLSTFWLI